MFMHWNKMDISYITRHNQDFIITNYNTMWLGQHFKQLTFHDTLIFFISGEFVAAALQRGNTKAVMLQSSAEKGTAS